jgi:pyrimidine operon attenuation protein/uracil phosphoribosyltransferase
VLSNEVYRELHPLLKDTFRQVGQWHRRAVYSNRKEKCQEPTVYGHEWRVELTPAQCNEAIDNITHAIIENQSGPLAIIGVLDPESPGGIIIAKEVAERIENKRPEQELVRGEVRIEGRAVHSPRRVTNLRLPQLQEHSIIIVDDVSISGRTIEVTAEKLKAHGVSGDIRAATIALGRHFFDKVRNNEANISNIYFHQLLHGPSVVFPWGEVGATGNLAEEFNVLVPDIKNRIDRPWGWMSLQKIETSVRYVY